MALVSDRCICLRKVEYSESSQILTLFSRDHGLVRAIAKGAHRRTKAGASKFDGGVDLLDLGAAVFTHDPSRDLETLTEWGLREGHLGLRTNLRAMYLALYAGELCSLLIEEHDPHPVLFDLLEQTLRDLQTPRLEESFLTFQLDLLRETATSRNSRPASPAASNSTLPPPPFPTSPPAAVAWSAATAKGPSPIAFPSTPASPACFNPSSAIPKPTAPANASPALPAIKPTPSTGSWRCTSNTPSAAACGSRLISSPPTPPPEFLSRCRNFRFVI